jgi:hypothetical protein
MSAMRTLWTDPKFLAAILTKPEEGANPAANGLAAGQNSPPDPAQEARSANSAGGVHVQVYKMPDPDPKVNLPVSDQTDPDVIVIDGGKKETMKRSAVLASPQYIDNAAQKMTAKPSNLTTLEVKTMQFTGSGGAFDVQLSDITASAVLPALSFERKGKMIYPLSRTGKVTIDPVNTPQIVKFAKWVLKEISNRRKLRLTITETTFMFQIALAELAAAVGAPEMPEGGATELPAGGRIKPPGRGTGEPIPKAPETPAKPVGGEPEPAWKEIPIRHIPDNEPVEILTSKGPRKMTVGEYRDLVGDADNWVTKNRVGNPRLTETDLREQAAQKFGLDKNWWDIKNPNYHARPNNSPPPSH